MPTYLIADQELVESVLDKVSDVNGKIELDARDMELICNLALKSLTDDTLFVDDIRNKLSPITALIDVIEMDINECSRFIPQARKSVRYLAQKGEYTK